MSFFSSPFILPCSIILLIEFQLQLNKLLEQNVIIRKFVLDKFLLLTFLSSILRSNFEELNDGTPNVSEFSLVLKTAKCWFSFHKISRNKKVMNKKYLGNISSLRISFLILKVTTRKPFLFKYVATVTVFSIPHHHQAMQEVFLIVRMNYANLFGSRWNSGHWYL